MFQCGFDSHRGDMMIEHECGCITAVLKQWHHGKLYESEITQLCSKHLAEAEQEQHQPPKLESGGSNPPCESTAPSPNGDGSGLIHQDNVGSSPTGAM